MTNTGLKRAKYERKVNRAEAIGLRVEGKTYQQIGDHFGVTRSAIQQMVNNNIKSKEILDLHIANRSLTYADIEARAALLLTDDKLEELNALELTLVIKRLYELLRLEQGKATTINEQVVRFTKEVSLTDYKGVVIDVDAPEVIVECSDSTDVV